MEAKRSQEMVGMQSSWRGWGEGPPPWGPLHCWLHPLPHSHYHWCPERTENGLPRMSTFPKPALCFSPWHLLFHPLKQCSGRPRAIPTILENRAVQLGSKMQVLGTVKEVLRVMTGDIRNHPMFSPWPTISDFSWTLDKRASPGVSLPWLCSLFVEPELGAYSDAQCLDINALFGCVWDVEGAWNPCIQVSG